MSAEGSLQPCLQSRVSADDKTPPDWVMPEEGTVERVKKPLRWLLYAPYLRMLNPLMRKRYDPSGRLGVDQWYWGHRGFEYQFLRRRLNQYRQIRGSSVLVVGCGTGRDLGSWMRYQPARLLGADLFNYAGAWKQLKAKYGGCGSALSFVQGDITELSLNNSTFDIIGSDAVLEHVTRLATALNEFHRVLRPDGILYAAFGPLWHCWGGDHFSGYDAITNGYNHLILQRQDYIRYLAGAGDFIHSEDDGRTWVQNGLFSYLKIAEYFDLLKSSGFSVMYCGLVVEPKAVKCLARKPEVRSRLLRLADELDLITIGVCVIARKASTQSL